MASGYFALKTGIPADAIKYFELAISGYNGFLTYFMLGRACFEAKQYSRALGIFENLRYVYLYWNTSNCIWDTELLYYLARSYEKTGIERSSDFK